MKQTDNKSVYEGKHCKTTETKSIIILVNIH